jgi:hypothetical protein
MKRPSHRTGVGMSQEAITHTPYSGRKASLALLFGKEFLEQAKSNRKPLCLNATREILNHRSTLSLYAFGDISDRQSTLAAKYGRVLSSLPSLISLPRYRVLNNIHYDPLVIIPGRAEY